MDKEIRELIDLISSSNFVEFELEREGFKIKLVKAQGRPRAAAPDPTSAASALAAAAEAPVAVALSLGPEARPKLHEIKSPLVGTFYRAASPDAPTFTEVGKPVKVGQVLCIVEAMKLMNEIESDVDGVVEEVVVSNGQPVEYGEILFRVRPTSLVP